MFSKSFTEGPIQEFSWGRFVVDGEEHGRRCGVGKDIRVIGTEVTAWDERKGHTLRANMITGVLDRGLDALVIGVGVWGRISCPDPVKQFIRDKGIDEVFVQNTPEACETYNRLFREGKRAALLAHGTC